MEFSLKQIILSIMMPICVIATVSAQHIPNDNINLLQVSISKKSIIIDSGSFDGIEIGDRAKFYLLVDSDEIKYSVVAEGEAVKVYNKKSFWFLDRLIDSANIYVGGKLGFLSVDETVGGRGLLKILNKKRVYSKNAVIDEVSGVPKDIIYKKGLYEEGSEQLTNTLVNKWQDVELIEVKDWTDGDKYYFEEYGSDVSSKGANIPEKSRDSKKIRQKIKNKLFAYETQNSDSMSGHAKTYYYKKDDSETGEMDLITSPLEKHLADKKVRNIAYPGAISKVKREGALWSADFTDEELRNYVIKTGVMTEELKRIHALENKISHELFIRYNYALYNNTDSKDENNRGRGMAFALGYEFNFGMTDESLDRLSLDVLYAYGTNYYYTGSINTFSSEYYYKTSLNWYFYNTPSTIRKYLWYLGIGVKFGEARLEAKKMTEKVNYQLNSFPSYQLGIKYRFTGGDEIGDIIKYGLGLTFLMEYETLSLEAIETHGQNVRGKLDNYNLRIGLGLGFYF